ncbi:hypothetical protein [Mucilaginibacter glaciei]|nr:hypothetical protein [Mucilaginibacter glaciei]
MCSGSGGGGGGPGKRCAGASTGCANAGSISAMVILAAINAAIR